LTGEYAFDPYLGRRERPALQAVLTDRWNGIGNVAALVLPL
jgi:hypothetical protein